MKKEKVEHQPRYGIMLLAMIFVAVTFFVAWHLVMGVSEYSVSANIVEVIYKDNGFTSDSVKVFFANSTNNVGSLEFNFDANTYYNNSGSNLDYVYQLMKDNVGESVIITYSKAPIGDTGFINLTVR